MAGKAEDPSENVLFESTAKYDSTNSKRGFLNTESKLKSPDVFSPAEQLFKGTEEKERKRSIRSSTGAKVEAANAEEGLKKGLQF